MSKGIPKRGTPEFAAWARRRASRVRKVVSGKWLDGANADWWEFELECGHSGKLLLGRGTDVPTEFKQCYPCEREAKLEGNDA